jgi:hypothetical protein
MSGATSHHGVIWDNFNFEWCGIVNAVGEGRKRARDIKLLCFSVKYLNVVLLLSLYYIYTHTIYIYMYIYRIYIYITFLYNICIYSVIPS